MMNMIGQLPCRPFLNKLVSSSQLSVKSQEDTGESQESVIMMMVFRISCFGDGIANSCQRWEFTVRDGNA
jgi:hypothetical protein